MSKLIYCQRFTPASLLLNVQDSSGRLFLSSTGKSFDMSGVELLHFGIDTVRQLYKGTFTAETLGQLQATLELPSDTFTLNGQRFHLSKMGKVSGYRYKLQNNELGLVLLVGSYYAKANTEGAHLKIEASPHLIKSMTTNRLDRFLSQFADLLLKDAKPSGVALHFSVDFQGWEPERDFLERFVTRSRSFRDYFGLDECKFNFSDVATSYGKGESFTFGKADSLQTCLYRKDKEAIKRDKIDYWRGVWGAAYNPSLPVWRLEVRFHHTVLLDLGRDLSAVFLTLPDVEPYIDDVWHYALTNNRLELKKNNMAPIWQILRDDVLISPPLKKLRRVKKTSAGNVGFNIANSLGNLLSIYSREKKPFKAFWSAVKQLHIWELIKSYYWSRGMSEAAIYNHLQKAFFQRKLLGNAA